METEKEKTVNMKCRNPKCSSITAVELPYRPGTHMYRCTKCNHTKVVATGGSFNIKTQL